MDITTGDILQGSLLYWVIKKSPIEFSATNYHISIISDERSVNSKVSGVCGVLSCLETQ